MNVPAAMRGPGNETGPPDGTFQCLQDGCGVVTWALDEPGLAVASEADSARAGPRSELTCGPRRPSARVRVTRGKVAGSCLGQRNRIELYCPCLLRSVRRRHASPPPPAGCFRLASNRTSVANQALAVGTAIGRNQTGPPIVRTDRRARPGPDRTTGPAAKLRPQPAAACRGADR